MFIIKNKKIIILFLMCLLVFVPAPSGSSGMNPVSADSVIDDLQKQINDRQASIKASAARRKELEKSIANLKNQQAVAINDKRVYDNLIAEIEAEARETEALIEDLKELIARGETDIMNAQEEYDRSYGLFLEMIRFAHEEGDTDYLGMLLKSKSFTDFLARMDIISSMLEYNKNVIDSLVQSKETLEKAKQTHENMAEQNSEFVGHLAKISAEVKELSDKAEKAINQANRDLQENIALQAELDRDALSTQSEIARLSKELQARQESQRKYVGGTFLWPLPTANGRVSSGFGSRRSPITGRPEHHDGIDIPAPKNTDIYAVNDGTVIISGSSAGWGNYIVIDHGGGKTTLYAHNTQNLVKVNDNVKRGDVIGKVGSTGWSTGNHLHFGYYEDGVPKNPLLNGLSVP